MQYFCERRIDIKSRLHSSVDEIDISYKKHTQFKSHTLNIDHDLLSIEMFFNLLFFFLDDARCDLAIEKKMLTFVYYSPFSIALSSDFLSPYLFLSFAHIRRQ